MPDDLTEEILTDDSSERLGALADLLRRSGIDPSEIGRVRKVKAHQGFFTRAEPCPHCGGTGFDPLVVPTGEPDQKPEPCPECGGKKVLRGSEKVDMLGVELSPAWEEGPQWPVVQPCPPQRVVYPRQSVTSDEGWSTAVILPDMQIGYYRDRDDVLQPTHDEAALWIALQVVKAARPSQVVMVGDNLDFPELGKYLTTPAFARTTQAAIDRAGSLMAQVRVCAGPGAGVVWLAGNHEERLPKYLLSNSVAAFGLRKANAPESWPVLSIPYLCRTDEVGIEFRPGYPASECWINDRLRVIHGHKATKTTTTAYLNEERVSTIYGHVHRREWAERTRAARGGRRTILAASPGCLCRIDGKVPSVKGGWDHDGLPVTATEDWQQGLAVVQYQEGDGAFVYEQVAIHQEGDGSWARWRGREFRSAA